MRTSIRSACFLVVACCVAPLGLAAPPADLDRYARKVLQTFETPGMAVVLVEQGRPAVIRSYGVRRLGEPARVDEHTLFGIGSTTKAFTSALLAMLIDEGKLTWDTKVQDVLPGFKMYDPYASSEFTVRDLLTHRSGLGPGAGDLTFYPPTSFNREEIIHKLRYIKPVSSFRSGYAYDNLLYIVAGEVVKSVGGMPWEEAVRARILEPLGMADTAVSSDLPAGANRAWPHARVSTEVRGFGPVVALDTPLELKVAAAAGGLNASGSDVARWLETQLGRGVIPGTERRLFSEAMAHEMWTAQTLLTVNPPPPGLEQAKANFRAYALGWGLADYRGVQVVSHGGGVPGTVTQFAILPERNVALAIMVNSEEVGALQAMQYHLYDHYLGVKSPDWIKAVSRLGAQRLAQAQQVLAATASPQGTDKEAVKGPSLALEKYAGRYRDAWYGTVTIENASGALNIRFDHTPTMVGKLEHVRYDTFRTRWADRKIEDAYLTFALDAQGAIDRATMRAVSPLADFSFDYQDLLLLPEEAAPGK